MTTKPTTTRAFLPLPDPPEREPDDMTSVQHLNKNAGAHHPAQHCREHQEMLHGSDRKSNQDCGTSRRHGRQHERLVLDPPH